VIGFLRLCWIGCPDWMITKLMSLFGTVYVLLGVKNFAKLVCAFALFSSFACFVSLTSFAFFVSASYPKIVATNMV
jgi:hypothetical protein